MSLRIPDFKDVRVVVYGDSMLDRYWHGDADRISPEAPVPVVHVNQIISRPGGAANVALNCATLGCDVSLLGLIGQDPEGEELETILVQHGICCRFQPSLEYKTATKLRIMGQNQQLLRVDFEKHCEDYDDTTLVDAYQQELSTASIVVLSDYAKGGLFNCQKLIEKARKVGVRVLVDPKSNDFGKYQGATLLTPNFKEFEAVVGPCADETELVVKARHLISTFNFEGILVTRGKSGMMLISREKTLNLPAHARDVYDVTGAGDTVIATMAASLAAGCDFAEATHIANVAAGIVVRRLGTSPISLSELQKALQPRNPRRAEILNESELLSIIAHARQRGEVTVMTNGCFDILHAGHVYYLEKAKALGDRLIVAVNDDLSVKRLKGGERPVHALAERMEVLSGLRSVDFVIPFSEDTPLRLIRTLMPDVLVKGGDYTRETIVGADVVLKNGGTVFTIPLKPGCSTTHIINELKKEIV